MSPLTLFKKAPASPARAAFQGQMRAYREKEQQRQQVIAKDGATRRDSDRADAAAAKVQTLRAAQDELMAAHAYGDAPPADLEARKQELARAEAEAERLAAQGRAAEIAHRRFSAQSAALANEAQGLFASMYRLLHAALIEELEQDASGFREAEEAFRAKHRATFVRVAAADRLATVHQLGVFVGWGLYGDLFISRPNLPGYRHGSPDPWTNQQEHDESLRTLDTEADALLNAMLTEGAAD